MLSRLLIFSLATLLPVLATAQIHDFLPTRGAPFEFHHLQLTLELDQQSVTTKGVATWQISALKPSLEKLSLLTLRTEIRSVRINEKIVNFHMQGDSLHIPISEPMPEHVRFKLEIVYSSEASFALRRSHTETVFSSLLPGAVANLLPVLVHPSVQMPTDIRLIVPHHWQAVGTGAKLATTLLPEENRLFHWRSDVPVPVTNIAFFAGDITFQEDLSGPRPVRIYYSGLNLEESQARQLLATAVQMLATAEQVLDMRLPYPALNLIWLEEQGWELRTVAATMGFLSPDAGPLPMQLLRIVSGQYFGAWHRSAVMAESDHILALQGLLAQRIATAMNLDMEDLNDSFPAQNSGHWSKLNATSWNHAVQFNPGETSPKLFHSNQIRSLLREPTGVYTWLNYIRLTSDTLSARIFELPVPQARQKERYTAHFVFDESRGQYELELLPEGNYPSRFLNLTLRQFTDGMISDLDILASSRGDRIHISAGGWIENMYFLNTNPDIEITEVKPAAFWLYQLRRDSDADRRVEASDGFSRVVNDPDVQLVLTELIRNEPEEQVRRYLVSSLAAQLRGAVGTHQQFLTLLQDPSRIVRFAALQALTSYRGNEQVKRAVFRIISTSQDFEFVNTAIAVYFEVVDDEEFYSVGRGLLHEDQQDLYFTATIIPLLVRTERGKLFAPNLMRYMGAEYDFSMRILTFNVLKEMEISASSWRSILPSMLADGDPRIRYAALEKVRLMEAEDRRSVLSGRAFTEYDVRVLHRLQELLSD